LSFIAQPSHAGAPAAGKKAPDSSHIGINTRFMMA